MTKDGSSILHLYRRLLAARRASVALRLGDLRLLDAPDGVVAYERAHHQDRRTALINFTSDSHAIDVTGVVEVSSTGAREGAAFDGTLHPDEAVILRPA